MEDEYDTSYRDLLQWRAGDVTNKSLESTRRMRGLIDNSKEAGGQMLNNLDDQKEKLTAISGHMDSVAENVDEAEENLTRAECCGFWRWPWKTKGQFKEKLKKEKQGLLVNQQGKNDKQCSSNGHSGYIPRITEDTRENEMEENLQYVHGGVHDLRNFGLQIQSEVLAQNKLIDNIANKGESNIAHVKDANRRTEKIFK